MKQNSAHCLYGALEVLDRFTTAADKLQVVALHVQSTSMTGRVPCSWGDEGLMYLGVVGNKAMSGPLPTCFAQANQDIMINISENDPENPFCGSRSQQNPIAKQIPKCSNLDSVPEVCIPPRCGQ